MQKYGLKKTRNIYPTEIRHDVKIQIALIIIYFTLPSVAPLPSEKAPPARRGARERTFRPRCTPNVDPPENRREPKDGPKGLIKGLYRSRPGRRALISLVRLAPIRPSRRNLNQLALRPERAIHSRRKYRRRRNPLDSNSKKKERTRFHVRAKLILAHERFLPRSRLPNSSCDVYIVAYSTL